MEAELGYRQAVARQSWHRGSIRELVTGLLDEHPKAKDEELIRLAIQRMREDEEWLIAAGEYAVMQTLSTLHRRKQTAASPAQAAQRKAEVAAKAENIKEQIMLLNLEMPNGKRLRYCTREEVSKFNNGFTRLIKKMKPRQMVGQAFNEDQVKAIMK